MKYPNFIIAGAAKAGTSTLYKILRQHPEVFLTYPKEPQYFVSNEFKESENTDKPAFHGDTNFFDKETYEKLYEEVTDEVAVGEASTAYLHDTLSYQKIFEEVPDVRLIFMLRNPVDRAYSQFLHQVRDSREIYHSFSDALEAEEERKKKNWGPFWYYKSSGDYYRQLKPYFETFPRENIKVVIFEKFIKNKKEYTDDILEFLGINQEYDLNYSIHTNKTGYPKLKVLNDLINSGFLRRVYSKTKVFVPDVIPNTVKKIKNKNVKKEEMDNETRIMLKKFFKPDMKKLEKMLNNDLSIWEI